MNHCPVCFAAKKIKRLHKRLLMWPRAWHTVRIDKYHSRTERKWWWRATGVPPFMDR